MTHATRLLAATAAALTCATGALAQSPDGQLTSGQRSSLPPEMEGPGLSEGREMPAGNHTFTNEFPVASRVVANSELSDTYVEDGQTLVLSPPAIVMEGWVLADLDGVEPAMLEGVELYPQAWENLGAMGEIAAIEDEGVVVGLPELAGLMSHDVLLPMGALTILTPEGDPGSEFRAFVGTNEAVLRDLDAFEG